MRAAGFAPDGVTVASLLSCLAGVGPVGKQLHALSVKAGISSEAIIEGSLLHMYVTLSEPNSARVLFLTSAASDNVVFWNVLLLSHADSGDLPSCLSLFSLMLRWDPPPAPDHYTYHTLLRACLRSSAPALSPSLQLHARLLKSGLHLDLHICGTLISLYGDAGRPGEAERIFRNLPEEDVDPACLTCMIAAFAGNGLHSASLRLFAAGTKGPLLRPDGLCIASALNSAARLRAPRPGRQIHARCHVSGDSAEVCVRNSLVWFYACCGRTRDAMAAFSAAAPRDCFLWSSLISGLARSGRCEESLSVFSDMNGSGSRASAFAFGSALSAASLLGFSKQGQQVHGAAVKQGAEAETEVANALITLYARCGDVAAAEAQFARIPKRTAASWNAMISAYSRHGLAGRALDLIDTMGREGVRPDPTTFLAVLSACAHSGLVGPALRLFSSIPRPGIDHYSSVVDLLGRAGHLDRAHQFVLSMPVGPDAAVWTALLSACRVHGNIPLAETAALCLSELRPDDPAAYILLGNVYNSAGRWHMNDRIKTIMNDRGVRRKLPGFSWV